MLEETFVTGNMAVLGVIDLSVGRRHLLQGIWPCWGHWLKCGGVGVVLGQ